MLTINQIENKQCSKMDLFQEELDNNISFDFALPQNWLNGFSNWAKINAPSLTYNLIRSTTVWAYPANAPLFKCKEVFEAHNVFDT